MYYQKHVTDRRVKRCRRSLIVLVVVISFFTLNAALYPIVESMLQVQAERIFTQAVNEAVLAVVDGSVGADSFVELKTGDNGEVSSVQTDSAAVNRFRAEVSRAVAERLDEIEHEDLRIPIGSLLGGELFTGRGPAVKLRLVQKGSITADISGAFYEAGINQTCHQINCDVSARLVAIIPGVSVPVELNTTVMVAQSVIVGEVPDSYTYVIGDKNDTVGRIFDYGNPYGEDAAR